MADDDATTDEGQGPDGGTDGQEPPSDDAGTQDGASTSDQPDLKALQAELAATRREAAKRRTRERELEAKLAEHEQAQLSEQQKLEQKVARLESELAARNAADAERDRKALIAAEAERQKAVDPALIADLLATQLTEEDSDIPAAVKALLEQKAYLRAGPPATGGDANGSTSASDAARSGDGEETDEQRSARIYGGGGGMFDAKAAQKAGGGVVISSADKVVRR